MAAILVKLLVMIMLCSACAQAQALRCRTNEYIISRNEVITPPLMVEASNHASITSTSTVAANVLYFGYNSDDLYTWCSDTSDNNPYVIIHFSQPVFITSFLSSGSTDHSFSTLKTFYVTNFTMEHTNTSGDFNYYTTFGGQRKYFNQTEPVALFRLGTPIVTDAIRFRPIQASDGSETLICLGVALFGCTEAETMEEVTNEPFTMATTSSDSTASNTGGTTDNRETISTASNTGGTTDSSNTGGTIATASSTGGTTDVGGIATAQPVVLRDYQALEIALPIGIITIIIVITTVAIGVLLCVIKGRSQHKYDVSQSISLNPTSHILDNSALYNIPRPIDDGTIKRVNNELYGKDSRNNSLSAEASNLEVIYSDDNHYDFIAEQPTSKVKEGDTNSMCGNSAYELADHSEGTEATPTRREDFALARNNSYEDVDVHVENLYKETTH